MSLQSHHGVMGGRAVGSRRSRRSCTSLVRARRDPGPICIPGSMGCVGAPLNPAHLGSAFLLQKIQRPRGWGAGRRAGRGLGPTGESLLLRVGVLCSPQTPRSPSRDFAGCCPGTLNDAPVPRYLGNPEKSLLLYTMEPVLCKFKNTIEEEGESRASRQGRPAQMPAFVKLPGFQAPLLPPPPPVLGLPTQHLWTQRLSAL